MIANLPEKEVKISMRSKVKGFGGIVIQTGTILVKMSFETAILLSVRRLKAR